MSRSKPAAILKRRQHPSLDDGKRKHGDTSRRLSWGSLILATGSLLNYVRTNEALVHELPRWHFRPSQRLLEIENFPAIFAHHGHKCRSINRFRNQMNTTIAKNGVGTGSMEAERLFIRSAIDRTP